MKKIFTLSLVLASTLFAASIASAQSKAPQKADDEFEQIITDIRYDDNGQVMRGPGNPNNGPVFPGGGPGWNDRDNRNDRWDNRDKKKVKFDRVVRVMTKTRIVRQNRRVFRETVKITYFKSGKVTTQVISRVRIR